MKVVVVGATEPVGSHVARACLNEERITKVFIITRKEPIEEIAKSPKVEVILHQDFASWSGDLMKRLDGVEAYLWYVEYSQTFTPEYLNSCDSSRAVGGTIGMLNNDKD
jgi:nucleoside-diphosphate-sugar epimerase